MAATVFALVPFAAQAQDQAGCACPTAPGKELVSGVCTACHQTNMITAELRLYARGLERADRHDDRPVEPTRSSATTITAISRRAFPAEHQARAQADARPREITFKEWQTPTLGQRSRDPVQAADGPIWWAGQFGNLIGRLNPATGEMKEYPLPANAMPHTVELDAKGMPWYTGNKNGTVGKLDPATGKITVYKMPDPRRRTRTRSSSTSRASCGSRCRTSNMIGRLDPATGDIKLVTLRRRTRSRTASRSTPTARCGSRATARPASTRSIRRRWRSPKSSFRSRAQRCGASTSLRTA